MLAWFTDCTVGDLSTWLPIPHRGPGVQVKAKQVVPANRFTLLECFECTETQVDDCSVVNPKMQAVVKKRRKERALDTSEGIDFFLDRLTLDNLLAQHYIPAVPRIKPSRPRTVGFQVKAVTPTTALNARSAVADNFRCCPGPKPLNGDVVPCDCPYPLGKCMTAFLPHEMRAARPAFPDGLDEVSFILQHYGFPGNADPSLPLCRRLLEYVNVHAVFTYTGESPLDCTVANQPNDPVARQLPDLFDIALDPVLFATSKQLLSKLAKWYWEHAVHHPGIHVPVARPAPPPFSEILPPGLPNVDPIVGVPDDFTHIYTLLRCSPGS